MEKRGILYNIRFIFFTVLLLVLIFSAVVVTVLNLYSPTLKANIDGNFIGYFGDEEQFEDVYNTLVLEKEQVSEDVKCYLQAEPTFELCYILNSEIAKQNLYTNLRNHLSVEYTIYNVSIEDEVKMTFSSQDEANKYIAKLKEDVPKVKCSVESKKVETLGEMTTIEVANSIVEDVVSRNKPAPVVVATNTYVSNNVSSGVYATVYAIGASAEIAAKAASEGGLWPTTATYISSPYGWRWSSMHTGIDIAGRAGDPIYAYKTGYVVFSGWGGAYGYLLKVDHGNGMMTWYAHCSKLLVNVGDTVSQGEVIAREGTTGNSTGNHLHFEMRINGAAVNPWSYISPYYPG